MAEPAAYQVYYKRMQEDVLRSLLEQLHTTLAIYNVWGSYLGSANLFRQHAESRRKITDLVERMQVCELKKCTFTQFLQFIFFASLIDGPISRN